MIMLSNIFGTIWDKIEIQYYNFKKHDDKNIDMNYAFSINSIKYHNG